MLLGIMVSNCTVHHLSFLASISLSLFVISIFITINIIYFIYTVKLLLPQSMGFIFCSILFRTPLRGQ